MKCSILMLSWLFLVLALLFGSLRGQNDTAEFVETCACFNCCPIKPRTITITECTTLTSTCSFTELSLTTILATFRQTAFFSSVRTITTTVKVIETSSNVVLRTTTSTSTVLVPITRTFTSQTVITQVQASITVTSFSETVSGTTTSFRTSVTTTTTTNTVFTFTTTRTTTTTASTLTLTTTIQTSTVVSITEEQLLSTSTSTVLVTITESTTPTITIRNDTLIVDVFVTLTASPLDFQSVTTTNTVEESVLVTPITTENQFFTSSLSITLTETFIRIRPPP